MRLDKWLWAARFFKTRGLASDAIEGGKVDLNGEKPKRGKPDADPATGGIQGIALAGRNPNGELLYDAVRQKIVVPCVGNYGVQDGGAEFVDASTLQSAGFFVSQSTLGGDLTAVRLWDDCTGYALVSDASFNTKLVRFDHCLGTSAGACLTTPGFRLSDVEIHRDGTVFVTDRDLIAPGVRLFAAPGCAEITSAPLDFGLPPYDIAWARPQTLADFQRCCQSPRCASSRTGRTHSGLGKVNGRCTS